MPLSPSGNHMWIVQIAGYFVCSFTLSPFWEAEVIMSFLLQREAADSNPGSTGISRNWGENIPLGKNNYRICNMPFSPFCIQFLFITVFGHWSSRTMYWKRQMWAKKSIILKCIILQLYKFLSFLCFGLGWIFFFFFYWVCYISIF